MYIRARRVKILAWLRGHRLYSVLTWTCWNVEHVSLRSCSAMKEPGLWPDTAHRIKHALLTSVYACPPLSLHSQDPLLPFVLITDLFPQLCSPYHFILIRFCLFSFLCLLSLSVCPRDIEQHWSVMKIKPIYVKGLTAGNLARHICRHLKHPSISTQFILDDLIFKHLNKPIPMWHTPPFLYICF